MDSNYEDLQKLNLGEQMTDAQSTTSTQTSSAHFDVLIVGAGISGIGAGYHLKEFCPDRSFTILEGRDDLGGTWDLFRYPGIRSDSDMHTLGFSFKPWTAEKSIADGPAILDYLRETASEFGIDRHIQYRHHVSNASWSSEDSCWTVNATRRSDDGTETAVTYTAGFVFMCSGYYSYKGGFRPDFAGEENFKGQVVHPQHWPEDLDYAGKKVVVIGSGATAVTLVPAMADKTEHITMLQRSPTYMVSRPNTDALANNLRKVLPDKVAYAMTRWKNVRLTNLMYKRARSEPEKVKAKLRALLEKELPSDMIDEHFTPSYNPWDQRLCLVPNSDLFESITAGKASIVTDQIDAFTETGIKLKSGDELEADIIVTATGLQLVTLGEVSFSVDGKEIDFADTWSYLGLGYSDVPNLISSFGYINASWTLRADLTCEYVCRLLNHMKETNSTQATPRLRPSDSSMPARPWIDDFTSGYMSRSMHLLPKQGDRQPWINTQDYLADRKLFKTMDIADGVMQFGNDSTAPTSEQSAANQSKAAADA